LDDYISSLLWYHLQETTLYVESRPHVGCCTLPVH